jgi:hypothetical protein
MVAKTEDLRLHPTDYQDAPPEETFELSDLDHIMPKMYVQIALVFELEPEKNKENIIENLTAGLHLTLTKVIESIRILSGCMFEALLLTFKRQGNFRSFQARCKCTRRLASFGFWERIQTPLRLSLVIITDKKASSRHTNNSSRPIFQLH